MLEYPSGIYAGRYAELGDRATADGYVIVRDTVRHKKMAASYRQSRTARVRGLLHADGAAQVQGIVAGCAELRQAVYFSPQGYYKDMLYDLTLLENSATAQPLWHGGAEAVRRKEAVCVELLPRLTLRGDDALAVAEAEYRAMCAFDKYGSGVWPAGTYVERYGGGEATVRVEPYRQYRDVQLITIEVRIDGSRKRIVHRQLVECAE